MPELPAHPVYFKYTSERLSRETWWQHPGYGRHISSGFTVQTSHTFANTQTPIYYYKWFVINELLSFCDNILLGLIYILEHVSPALAGNTMLSA